MKKWFGALAVLAALACAEESAPPGPPTVPDAAKPAEDSGSDRTMAPVDASTPELVPPAVEVAPPDQMMDTPGSGACRNEPGPGNVVVPFFGPVFAGRYRVWNHFDHDEPKQFVDKNGYQVDWCGRRRSNQIDGHNGFDFMMPVGVPILAPADGLVTRAAVEPPFFCPLVNRDVSDQARVEILHTLPDGRRIYTVYKHFSRIDVAANQRVTAGQTLGLSGNSGCSTGPHLHMETWLGDQTKTGKPVVIDPFGWEGVGPDPWAARADGMPSLWLWKPGQAPDMSAP